MREAHARALTLSCTLVVVLAVALIPGAAIAAASGASGSSGAIPVLTPTTSPAATTPTSSGPVTVPAPTSSNSAGGISTADTIAIVVIAVLVIGFIAFTIMGDARRRTPAGEPVRDIDRPRGTVRPIEQRVKSSRAKAKNARRARRAGR